ncbi:MAG TPA: hypothetical protein GX714_02050 [Chloroflexi bacterium]|jgi:hypothetical protein|nr:hypothetical protein [Chloroflexota bacterium]
MSSLGMVLPWVAIGIVSAGVHLWMLRSAVERITPLEPGRAKTRLATSMPLRLLVVAPLLVCAARAGLWPCLGLVIGNVVCRWLWLWYVFGRQCLPIRCQKQG